MPHQIPEHNTGRPDYTSTSADDSPPLSLNHKIDVFTPASVFTEFTAPMLRNAGVFTARRDAEPIHDVWTPIDSSESTSILEWVRRELLTFGFLLELAFSEFSFAKDVSEELGRILEAFRSIWDGHAYVTLVDEKSAVAIFNGVQRTILAAGPRVIEVLGGDPVKLLHEILHGAAQMNRPHSRAEIAALLRWTDEAFVTYAIEQIGARPVTMGASNRPSKAERDTGEIVSVVLGRGAIAWATDHPIFTRVDKSTARTCKADPRRGALAKAVTTAG